MSTDFKDLSPEYCALWRKMRIRPERAGDVSAEVARILRRRSRYEPLEDSELPWEIIAILHLMECDLSFAHHLHNGDPMFRRGVAIKTVQVPAGRGPFDTWEESARDAIALDLDNVTADVAAALADRRIDGALFFLEKYNGFGYRRRGVNNPYLWSFSDLYTSGKYVADRVFSETAVSAQVGAAPIWAELMRHTGALWKVPSLTDEA